MAINIQSNYQNPQALMLKKYHEAYKKEVSENKVKPSNDKAKTDRELPEINKSNLRDFLSSDEKRVLKEVFGDLNVDKNTTIPYNHSNSLVFFKGNHLDIKL